MIINHKLTVDLVRPEPIYIEVTQDDRYTRNLQLRLTANGKPLEKPSDCNVAVSFRKKDGCAGCYDTMPDGSCAWSWEGDVLTVGLAPEVCTASGDVELAVTVLSQEKVLGCAGIILRVQPKPAADLRSRDYFSVLRFLPQPVTGEPEKYLQVAEVDEQGRVTAVRCRESTAGVGVRDVRATRASTEDGGENIITVTLTDGTQYDFSVYNGSRGSDATAMIVQVKQMSGAWVLVDATYAQLRTAVEAGRDVQLYFDSSDTYRRYYTLSHKTVSSGVERLVFARNWSTTMEYITVSADGTVTRDQGVLVSNTRKINGKALSGDVTLSASDVGAEGKRRRMGRIVTVGGVSIDTATKTLTFGSRSYILCGEEKHNVSGTTHDISAFLEGQWLYYDPVNKTFSAECGDWFVCLGAMWKPACFADLPMALEKLTVDGMPVSYTSRYYGKSVNVLGDSMTAGTGTDKVFHEWLGQLCGFATVNAYGLAGSSIAPKVDMVPAWEEGVQSFYERYTSMGNADAIIVFGGVNDWVTGRTLGTMADTGTDTFYGAMKALCAGLIARYPVKPIYVFSSLQNDYVNRPANDLAGTQWEGNTEGYNRKGHKLQDYTAAMGEVCAAYGISFCSLTDNLFYGLSGVLGGNGVNGIYGSDGLHPNAAGHKRIALKMAGFVNSN
ncbi:MAG: SGNH/GDSL hydrolase family protein [Ruminococcaceae bacterium]|nr:SGNH/GDSL hydrolase family protein [Oscillospiraceae bacterium]